MMDGVRTPEKDERSAQRAPACTRRNRPTLLSPSTWPLAPGGGCLRRRALPAAAPGHARRSLAVRVSPAGPRSWPHRRRRRSRGRASERHPPSRISGSGASGARGRCTSPAGRCYLSSRAQPSFPLGSVGGTRGSGKHRARASRSHLAESSCRSEEMGDCLGTRESVERALQHRQLRQSLGTGEQRASVHGSDEDQCGTPWRLREAVLPGETNGPPCLILSYLPSSPASRLPKITRLPPLSFPSPISSSSSSADEDISLSLDPASS